MAQAARSVEVDFDLSRLAGWVLDRLVAAMAPKDSPLITALYDELMAEELARRQGHAGRRTCRLELVIKDSRELAAEYRTLTDGVGELLAAAAVRSPESVERSDLIVAAELLFRTGEALLGLCASGLPA